MSDNQKIIGLHIAPSARIANDAVVCGNVQLDENSSIWFHTTIRSEYAHIHVGENSNIQDNCVLHIDVNYPEEVGCNVTVGHGVILHGCTIGDGTLVGMGSIILNGAVIGKECIIGAGALVTQGTVIPDGCMAFGNPARVIRPLTDEEKAINLRAATGYVEGSAEYVSKGMFHYGEGK